MTVVNPKSISGITSITTASGSDNLLTIHTSDANNTERLRIDSTGTTKIVTGIVTTLTATTGDITTLRAPTGIVTSLTTNTLTANSTTKVGSGITLSPDGHSFVAGVSTTGTLSVSGIVTSTGDVDPSTGTVTTSGNITVGGDLNLESVTPSIKLTDSNQESDNKTFMISGSSTKKLRIQALSDAGGGGGQLFEFVRDGNNVYQFQGAKSAVPWFVVNNNIKKVGIGTTNPEADLHVSSGANTEIRIGDTSATPSYGKIVYNNDDDNADALVLEVDGGNDISGSNIRFRVDGSEKARILSTGGITFNGDTATSNALDDYEEGTWTPSWGGASVFGTSSYSTNQASYKKIGRLVYVNGYTEITGNTGGSGAWFCTNLPFIGDNGTYYVAPGSCMLHNFNLPDTALWVVTYKNSNTNDLSLYYSRDNSAWAQLQVSHDTSFRVIFSLTYHSTS